MDLSSLTLSRLSDKSRISGRCFHSSQPEIQVTMSHFPSALAAVVASSPSSVSISAPYLSINRMTYSLNSFNQQFRRLSQLSNSPQCKELRSKSITPELFTQCNNPCAHQTTPLGIWCCEKRRMLSEISSHCLECTTLCTKTCPSLTPLALTHRYLPAIQWLSEYQRRDLMSDLLTGLTIAVFHVPECENSFH